MIKLLLFRFISYEEISPRTKFALIIIYPFILNKLVVLSSFVLIRFTTNFSVSIAESTLLELKLK